MQDFKVKLIYTGSQFRFILCPKVLVRRGIPIARYATSDRYLILRKEKKVGFLVLKLLWTVVRVYWHLLFIIRVHMTQANVKPRFG